MGNASSKTEAIAGQQIITHPLPPPGVTSSLCARCLTLLSLVITRFGDGTSYTPLGDLPHSTFTSSPLPTPCPICVKARRLFDGARAHVSFEDSLRKVPASEWSLSWQIDCSDPRQHRGRYGWGIGSFRIYPDVVAQGVGGRGKQGDFAVITPLPVQVVNVEGVLSRDARVKVTPDVPLQSNVPGSSYLPIITEWIHECSTSHPQCQNIYGVTEAGSGQAWYPSRLLYFDHGKKVFRIVDKNNPADANVFRRSPGAQDLNEQQVGYISLSHCWGPPPDPTAPNGGRQVLTTTNLAEWSAELPVDSLAPMFQHALVFTALIGCHFIWIDSLCILQDSKADWLAESATMGDVYKYALFNVAALSATSDNDGFLNNKRNNHVEFGFRAPFATLLGREGGERRVADDFEGQQLEQKCILLRGSAKLCWAFDKQITTAASNSLLFTRGWVYQEKCLARRTLAFTDEGVFWACDGGSRAEQPEWAIQSMEREGLRYYQRLARDSGKGSEIAVLQHFYMRWHMSVTSYTLCNLTRQTDKLIAVGAIAREMASSGVDAGRYLAGLWETALVQQLDWLCVTGRQTPARKCLGDAEYVAPSWSWASITAAIQPRMPSLPSHEPETQVVLAEVTAVDVQTLTDYVYGAVKSGWVRLRARLNAVTRVVGSTYRSGSSATPVLSLIDRATGGSLWFSSDTADGRNPKAEQVGLLAWMPLRVRFQGISVECSCLVLQEVEADTTMTGYEQQPGRRLRVFRRLGTGNFGRTFERLAEDKLMLSLGKYVVATGSKVPLAADFKPRGDGYEEFVLI
ncbi:hypothetical protein LTR01_000174 [Friedmanniomyces endolithicus]|nr:hypothetical protein LTR01_000174 [Friedmanniomyces endolithicus]KAK0834602.1 hypothetical protein LTR73_000891 [Friedmanniomyces endolithicus]